MFMEEILQQIKFNLRRDYIASTIIGIDGMYLAFDTTMASINGDRLAAELADGIKNIMEMVKETSFGGLHYLNINTEKYKILLSPLGFGINKARYFYTLIIKQDGNIGKALLEMERTQKLLAKEMSL